MIEIDLSLSGKINIFGAFRSRNSESAKGHLMNEPYKNNKTNIPLMGYYAFGFCVLGIFTIGFILVPLGFIYSIFAFFNKISSLHKALGRNAEVLASPCLAS